MKRTPPLDWPALLARPTRFTDAAAADWFARIADLLLNRCRLVVDGVPHRLIEVEAYYRSADHPDPFPHGGDLQRQLGRWYFHRTGGVYRGGSFKGVDVTFGDGTASGAFLLRGLETPDGRTIDGPSLLVDHLLKTTGRASVAALDAAVGERRAWDTDSPLALTVQPHAEPRPVLSSLRVGLSLKRQVSAASDPAVRFLLKSYRYLSEPRRTAKGKVQMVLPLLAAGKSVTEVTGLTGCPGAAVNRYLAAFTAGRGDADFAGYYGTALTPVSLCRLYGQWVARHGVS